MINPRDLSQKISNRIQLLVQAFMDRNRGQISNYNEIGRWIQTLASLENSKVIVEIGTWNGRGSSRCIVDGVLTKSLENIKETKVLGLEIDKAYFNKARLALAKHDFFTVYHGTIVKANELDSKNLSSQEIKWFHQDQINIQNSSYVLDELPREINLLILDGGEFSTYSEYSKLANRVDGYIVLDDTKVRKCSKIMKELAKWDAAQLIYDSDERNGVAIFKITKKPK